MQKKIIWILVIAVLAIAIALGVGLGVGLNQNDNHERYTSPLDKHDFPLIDRCSSSLEGINATLFEIAQRYNFPALGAGFNNGTSHTAVVGVRKAGTAINATTDDIWHFGSNSKAMTATTIGILIQDGLLRWDSSLGELLGGIGISISETYDNVTVQLLSSHTSGISDTPLRASGETLLAAYELNAAQGRVLVSNLTLSAAPAGTQGSFEYSNMNYILLGLIIDTVTGRTAEDVVRSRLWNPLGISTGGWGPNPESSLTSVDNPWPHNGTDTSGEGGLPSPVPDNTPMVVRDNPPCYHTAGAAHMSIGDYNRWLRLHFDPAIQAKLNMSQELMTKLHDMAPGVGQAFYTYGGWNRLLSESGSGYTLSHDGSNTLNYATAMIDLGLGCAAVAVTNVGGDPAAGAPWLEGTHLVRDDLISGKMHF